MSALSILTSCVLCKLSPAGMAASGAAGSSHVLTPMLDLFSHLRTGAAAGGDSKPGAGPAADMHHGGLANGGANMHPGGAAGYTGMLLRGSGGAPGVQIQTGNQPRGSGGTLAQLGAHSPSASQAMSEAPNSLGGLLGGGGAAAPGPLIQQQGQAGGGMHGVVQHPGAGGGLVLGGAGGGAPGAGNAGGVVPNGAAPAAATAAAQHNAAAAAAAALGLARISIRDSLRLALGWVAAVSWFCGGVCWVSCLAWCCAMSRA